MHHWRSVKLVEGEEEGGEVGKLVKSHRGGQSGEGKMLQGLFTNFFSIVQISCFG